MDQINGDMEENFRVNSLSRFWGFRPWKRHGLILMVGGFLYILVGFLYALAPPSAGREMSLKVVLQIAPIEVWGGLFILSGLLTMISSRWPPFSEKWGYMILTGMSSGWSATYLLGVIFFDSPSIGLSQVVIWAIMAFMWWAISGLYNPDGTAVVPREQL